MANISIDDITLPDEVLPVLLEALAWKYPQKFADPAAPTGAEAKIAARDWLVYRLRNLYREYKRDVYKDDTGADDGIA